MRFFLKTCFLLACLGFVTSCSSSQPYPEKDLTFIVQSAPGGPSDFVGQTLSAAVEPLLGKQINVIYKPGASGSIGMSALAQAKPDGYTIGLVAGELALLKALNISDLVPDDFSAIMLVLKVPAIIAVHSDSPFKTLDDLVSHAKTASKPLTSGNAGTGSIWRLAGSAFANKAGIKIISVPFDGGGPAKTALLGKHVDMVTIGLGDVLNESKAGQIRILAMMADQRVSIAPNIPTLREQGYDLSFESWLGIAGPKNLPDPLKNRLYQDFKKAFEDPKTIAAYEKRGYVHEDLAPAAFAQFMTEQVALFKPLLNNDGE